MTNAIKFTPAAGSITVTMTRLRGRRPETATHGGGPQGRTDRNILNDVRPNTLALAQSYIRRKSSAMGGPTGSVDFLGGIGSGTGVQPSNYLPSMTAEKGNNDIPCVLEVRVALPGNAPSPSYPGAPTPPL